MKLEGRLVVKSVSETAKIDEAVSKILNNFPVVVPLVPIFKANKSPVAVVALPGDQSRFINDPVPAAPVKEVAVALISTIVPVVNVFPVGANWANFPVVNASVVTYIPVPEVMAVASRTKPEVVVVPDTTLEVKV